MALSRRQKLWELACQVALELNTVEDDDEREILQAQFEKTLNEELFAGSKNREMAAATAETAVRMLREGSRLRAVPSVSSDPRDGYALDDPKRHAFEGSW